MTAIEPERQPSDVKISDADVCRYLREHPDYFEQHPDELVALKLPHVGREGAASLLERQVELLRSRQHQAATQLRELIGFARENDRTAERLHQVTVALLECRPGTAGGELVEGALRTHFGLEWVAAARAAGPQMSASSAPAQETPAGFEALWAALDGKPRCGVPSETGVTGLTPPHDLVLASVAIIPFWVGLGRGIVVLGSCEPERFNARMGTVYLTRLGDILGRALERTA